MSMVDETDMSNTSVMYTTLRPNLKYKNLETYETWHSITYKTDLSLRWTHMLCPGSYVLWVVYHMSIF